MTEPPPPRYRVVEEGRRLVVIDCWAESGRPSSITPLAAETHPTLLGAARQTKFDGSAELTTHPFYDDKAPRTIRLDPGSADLTKAARWAALPVIGGIALIVFISPWLLLPAAFVALRSHSKIRAAITRWLDRIEAG